MAIPTFCGRLTGQHSKKQFLHTYCIFFHCRLKSELPNVLDHTTFDTFERNSVLVFANVEHLKNITRRIIKKYVSIYVIFMLLNRQII